MESFESAVKVLEEEYAVIPNSDDLVNKITKKFRQFYDNPPVEVINEQLSLYFSVDEIRELLFRPSFSHARYPFYGWKKCAD